MRRRSTKMALAAAVAATTVAHSAGAQATGIRPPLDLLTADLLDDLRQLLDHPLVALALTDQNRRHAGQTNQQIAERDALWTQETQMSGAKPFVGSVMSNPLSNYVTTVQANGLGLMAAILVVDQRGLNAGMSAPSDDFFQGDEDWFTDALAFRGDETFIGQPGYHSATGTWRVKVAFPYRNGGTAPIGVVRMELNMTELERRSAL